MVLSGQLRDILLYLWRNCPRFTLHRSLGGPQTSYGNLAEEKNFLPLRGIEECQIQMEKPNKNEKDKNYCGLI
jgi:hypothetical protein